jgi:hypothetical protein
MSTHLTLFSLLVIALFTVQVLMVLALVIVTSCLPQNFFTVNRQIASAQRGGYQFGGRLPGDVQGARPSVDPSAYYSGANRAKISRMLANYNYF